MSVGPFGAAFAEVVVVAFAVAGLVGGGPEPGATVGTIQESSEEVLVFAAALGVLIVLVEDFLAEIPGGFGREGLMFAMVELVPPNKVAVVHGVAEGAGEDAVSDGSTLAILEAKRDHLFGDGF